MVSRRINNHDDGCLLIFQSVGGSSAPPTIEIVIEKKRGIISSNGIQSINYLSPAHTLALLDRFPAGSHVGSLVGRIESIERWKKGGTASGTCTMDVLFTRVCHIIAVSVTGDLYFSHYHHVVPGLDDLLHHNWEEEVVTKTVGVNAEEPWSHGLDGSFGWLAHRALPPCLLGH